MAKYEVNVTLRCQVSKSNCECRRRRTEEQSKRGMSDQFMAGGKKKEVMIKTLTNNKTRRIGLSRKDGGRGKVTAVVRLGGRVL